MRRLLRAGFGVVLALVLSAGESRAGGKATIEIHGLFAFVPDGQGYTAVCVSTPEHVHFPSISVNPNDIDPTNPTPGTPNGLGGGDARYSWSFTDGRIDPSNVDNKIPFKPNRDKLGNIDENDQTKIRWVPQMDDIFSREVTYSIVNSAGKFSIGDGELVPIFDRASHLCQPWDIGDRKNRVLADGFTWTIRLKKSDEPLKLILESGKYVLLKSGAEIDMSCYPGILPTLDLEHFHLFYTLVQGGTGPQPKKKNNKCMVPGKMTPNPARCAPVLFP